MGTEFSAIAETPNARRVPAEWEDPSAIWLAWPHNRDTWPGRFDPIPSTFARFANLIRESAPVRILAHDDLMPSCLAAFGGSLPRRIQTVPIATNDCWIRDYGPTFVHDARRKQTLAINWRYNAWGGKYPPWEHDDAAARAIAAELDLECRDGDLCLEGGALEVDGLGRLITTGCLLTETRNPRATQESVARVLYRELGIHEIVWIESAGLEGDDTDGHVDQLARFIDPSNVVVASASDSSDPNHPALEDVYRQLRLWGQSTDPSVQVHRLPIPPRREINGQRIPESYCNFLRLGRDRILMPTFGAKSDEGAAATLEALSGAEVVGIDCRDLAWGLGALHCASREVPADTW